MSPKHEKYFSKALFGAFTHAAIMIISQDMYQKLCTKPILRVFFSFFHFLFHFQAIKLTNRVRHNCNSFSRLTGAYFRVPEGGGIGYTAYLN